MDACDTKTEIMKKNVRKTKKPSKKRILRQQKAADARLAQAMAFSAFVIPSFLAVIEQAKETGGKLAKLAYETEALLRDSAKKSYWPIKTPSTKPPDSTCGQPAQP